MIAGQMAFIRTPCGAYINAADFVRPTNALARKVGLVYRLPPEMQSEFRKANIYLPAVNGDDSWELPVPATYLVGQEGVIRDAFVDVDYYHRKDPRELITELKKISS
jgi:peroxiredoxin